MHVSRSLCRLLAGTLGLSLSFAPMSAIALSPLEQLQIPAAASVSLLSLESDPSASYRFAARRLADLGLTAEEINLVWGRLGPSLVSQLNEGTLSTRHLEYLALPYCQIDCMDRYLAYGQSHPDLSVQDVATQVNIGLDRDFYTQPAEIASPGDPLVLVNKYRALSPDYAPDLVRLGSAYGSGALTAEAAEAFRHMADAARNEGISLRSVSAYRSYATQSSIYSRYVSQNGRSLADTFSARPGYSEHQTGLALDINTASTSAHFENTREYAWLIDNCAQYGFLLRYPAEKEAVTGYRFEPWHYRYVGPEIARICMDQGLTFEEYIARLPVPGAYQVPSLYYLGSPVVLGASPLVLDDIPYLPAAQLAQALGWTLSDLDSSVILSSGPHRLTLLQGRWLIRDGVSTHLAFPALYLEKALYLSLPDLCRALDLEYTVSDRGLELSLREQPDLTVSI